MVRDDSLFFKKEVFGNIVRHKRLLEARIASIQKDLEWSDSLNLVQLERNLQYQYSQV